MQIITNMNKKIATESSAGTVLVYTDYNLEILLPFKHILFKPGKL